MKLTWTITSGARYTQKGSREHPTKISNSSVPTIGRFAIYAELFEKKGGKITGKIIRKIFKNYLIALAF